MTPNLAPDAATVLYVNSTEPNCGVHQFGRAIGEALSQSRRHRFIYRTLASADELHAAVAEHKPSAIIYNFVPATMPWLKRRTIANIAGPQIGTIHEVTQAVADSAAGEMFDYHIAPDPTLLLTNPIVFKTGRLLPDYKNISPLPAKPVIGTWGFGYSGKGFERVVRMVEEEFDEATIRLHMPVSPFMDPDGAQANTITQRCEDLVTKPGVELIVSHDFLPMPKVLDFLAGNTLNAFFYARHEGRGLSSVLDVALAAGRPIALTRSFMFRHLFDADPSIFVEDRSLHDIIDLGAAPLRPFIREWSKDNIVWDYERAVDKALAAHRKKASTRNTSPLKVWARAQEGKVLRKLNKRITRRLTKLDRTGGGPWLTHSAATARRSYVPSTARSALANVPASARRYNRILDNAARRIYGSTTAFLFSLAPDIMERKIAEANVQQAFVFDAVRTLAPASGAILCVGSFEDTACLGLKAIGFNVEEIDPVINYDLGEFIARPSTVKGSYDAVFSTSVIEHVEDDEGFMRDMSALLKPGGVAVLTCDYNDQYKKGDSIPSVCHRMYTQADFRQRIIPSAVGCSLLDEPQWDCPDPDFVLSGKFRYTFATLGLRKASDLRPGN